MESKIAIATTTSITPSKRLLFDRRYGWVYDEWTEPPEVALSGGRGMFCILPLAKTLLRSTTQSIHAVVHSTAKVLERPDLLSPQVLQDQLHKLVSSVQQPELKLFTIKGNSLSQSTSSLQASALDSREP